MALTPDSGQTAYATPDFFMNRFDPRLIGQAVRSDGLQSTVSQLESDPVLMQALKEGSGEVEAALKAGQRYATVDLQAVNGNSQVMLQGLVCDLAFPIVRRFRGLPIPPELVPQMEEARAKLGRLRSGENVLAFAETESAGNPYDRMRTYIELDNARLLTRTSAAFRFMGRAYPGRWGIGGWRF